MWRLAPASRPPWQSSPRWTHREARSQDAALKQALDEGTHDSELAPLTGHGTEGRQREIQHDTVHRGRGVRQHKAPHCFENPSERLG